MIVCRICKAETLGIDAFTRYCPNGLDDKHQIVFKDGTAIPEYIVCEKCGQIYPTKRATHYHFEFGWVLTTYSLVYFRPDLYDLSKHLCFKCTPDRLKKWDYVRAKITGRGK